MPYPEFDDQWEEGFIEDVERDSGGFQLEGGWWLGVPDNSPITPLVGMKYRVYRQGGLGGTVRGLFFDEEQIYYRTREEEAEKHRQWCKDFDQEQKDNFEVNRKSLDAKYEALPSVFRHRIDRFRHNNPDFRWKYEGYEMTVCETAVKIIDGLKTEKEIIKWKNGKNTFNDKRIDLDDLGLSGNQFDCAVVLARLYVGKRQQDVVGMIGAMAPLVGSKEYGGIPRGD